MFKNLLIALLALTLGLPATAANFYVATTGNNSNPGTQAQPWRTIQYACDNATPGSTVYIMAGTYTEQVWMNVSGTAGNYITFTHFANDVVTLDGGATNTQKVLLTISGQRYIRITGLKFANAMGNFSAGIIVQDNSDHIELLDNEIYNIHFSTNPAAPVTPSTNVNPLILYGTHATTPVSSILISGNTIRDCRTGYSEALTANGNVDGFTITGNTIHDITNIGIDLAGGYGVCPTLSLDAARNGLISNNIVYNCVSTAAVAAGIYADGSRDILIEHNSVHDCGRGYEVGCENPGKVASNIIVRDNIAYHNREAAIGIGGYDYPSTGKVTTSKILHNTCYDNVWTNNGDGELLIEYTENCTIENNLFYATNPAKYLIVTRLNSTGLALDYNLYFHSTASTSAVKVDWNGVIYTGFGPYQSATGKDVNSIFSNPLLTNPAAQDFHLSAGSPAYNAGNPAFSPAAGETDLDGDNRLLLGRVDIGVDESSVALPVAYLAPLSGRIAPQGIELRWSTTAERIAARFEVEKSADGLEWDNVGNVAARGGASDATTPYGFLDKTPFDGLNYYRLRQIDLDGQAALSNVAVLEFRSLAVTVFPNPVVDFFEIKSAAAWERAILKNESGQEVRVFLFSEKTPLTGLAGGVYWLEVFIEQQDAPVVLKIVKW